MEKDCLYCKKTFEVKRTDSVYCSRSCRQMAYMERKMDRLKLENLSVTNKVQLPSDDQEIDQDKRINEGVVVPIQAKVEPVFKQEEEYVITASVFLDKIRERIDDGSILLSFHACISMDQEIHSYWTGLRLLCLTECLLLFSECKFTKIADLMDVCNAFTFMQRSTHFKNLPASFPYIETINWLREKLKQLCIKAHKNEQIRFRLKQEDKIDLIAMRYELTRCIPKMKFNQLNFE